MVSRSLCQVAMRSAGLLLAFLLTLASEAALAQESFFDRLADSTLTLTRQKVIYDPSYFRIAYPKGDVPASKGVCTDVVIRAYRKLGVDLQKEVHEDMRANFAVYPKFWGMKGTDTNIDHRRVPNLMTFFARFGTTLSRSTRPEDYRPGDIVCWDLGRGVKHIGIVIKRRSTDGNRPLIVHNIGLGQVVDDCLFRFTIIGHYRYRK